MSDDVDVSDSLANPILNSPYEPPARHFELGPHGPTGLILDGRRPSESFVPVPVPKKTKKAVEQATLDFDHTPDRVEVNTLINDIRTPVELWRARGYPGVSPYTRKLLLHWAAGPHRDDPVFFCQREAAETAIFLAEVAGRHGTPDFRVRIEPENRQHNDGLPRVGLKMATGTGKTVVMAMLIAWQTINKVATPNDARFAKKFLIVTPGITIRDRLQVLEPTARDNYYKERDLVPADLWDLLVQAQLVVTNYHAFLPRTAKEFQGVARATREILLGDPTKPKAKHDPTVETPDQIVARVLRDLAGHGKGEIVVLNDEAHHCYRDKPLDDGDDEAVDAQDKKERKERNESARVWFRGLQHVRKKVGVKAIYDLSATPFYLGGSGYQEGFIFPWVVSDFSLMDAIESGIVKVPRIPVDDDAVGDLPTYLRLWDHVGTKLPKTAGKKAASDGSWVIPPELEGAAMSLYRSYEAAFKRYEGHLAKLGEPPPVFIVVCPNTIVSKLVYDWIAGLEFERDDGEEILRAGALPLLSNLVDGRWVDRPRTILIDSAQLESGEALKDDFKKAAATEIEAFKREYVIRNPGADAEALSEEDLLREVMNTVGKPGRLGEQVRCVVSVSMLTEGWDANTVSHVLGIRRFGSQLLCEQVVGRGLRRRSYAINDETGHFDPEYAEVYGVPFAFIPSDRPIPKPEPKNPAVEVRSLDSRADLRISFPNLDGYRVELPDEPFHADFGDESRLHVSQANVATWTETQGIVGAAAEQLLDDLRAARPQQVAYAIGKRLVDKHVGLHAAPKPWLFPNLVALAKEWLDGWVTLDAGVPVGMLLLTEAQHLATEKVDAGISRVLGRDSDEHIRARLRSFDREGSTDDVSFFSRKQVEPTTRSHVNYVVLDGKDGNEWERKLAQILDAHPAVYSYVKNDHLGFTIPYVYEGRSYDYVPDFLVRLVPRDDGVDRTLILEVSGSQKAPGPTQAKAETAKFKWCVAVNNEKTWGRWGYAEYKNPKFGDSLDRDIDNLYGDGPITGLRH